MPRRHHNNVVVRRELHPRGNIRKAAADDLIGARIALRLCKRRAVVIHRHAKAHRREHRHERAANVSAAEDIDSPRAGERLDIKPVAPERAGREILPPLGWKIIAREHEELPDALALEREQQPEVDALIKLFAPAPQHGDIRRCLRGKKLEVHRHPSTADHADVADVIRVQLVGGKPVFAAFHRLERTLRAQLLHRAAANGAARAPVFKNRHLRARAARRGAGGGKHAAKRHALAARERGKHRVEYLLHPPSLSFQKYHALARL